MVLFAAAIAVAVQPSTVPMRLSANGHSLKASYTVELRDGTLTCTTFGPRRRNPHQTVTTPSEAEWSEFRQALDDLKFREWHREYSESEQIVVDGEDWSLEIAYDDQEVKSIGASAYPDATGKYQPRRTDAFRRYLSALSRLCVRAQEEFE